MNHIGDAVYNTPMKQQANNTKLNGMKFAVFCLLYYFRRISVLKYTLLFTCKWWSFQKIKSLTIVDMKKKKEIIKKAVTEFFIFSFLFGHFPLRLIFAYLYVSAEN